MGHHEQCGPHILDNVMQLHHENMSVLCTYISPFQPNFYKVKMGFTGVYLFHLFLIQNIDCGCSLEPPRCGSSKVYPQSMFWPKILKTSNFFQWNFQLLLLKNSLYIAWANFRNACSYSVCSMTILLFKNKVDFFIVAKNYIFWIYRKNER